MKIARIGALLGATALAVGVAGPALAQTKNVMVTAIVEHPALDATRDGVRDELEAQGIDFEFTYESAQGNPATAAQIARQFVGEEPDVIVAIATPSAQAVVAATQEIPVVFTAVTDPVGAQLVSDPDNPGGNVTGVSDMSPIQDHLNLIREILPDAKTLGVPYNPGEANAVALVNLINELAPEVGFTIVEAPATKSSEALGAAQSLIGRSDAIYVPTDNTIVSALEAVLSVGTDNGIPVFSGDTDSVERGAIATVGFNYYQIGRQTGKVVAEVLNGADPGSIPVQPATGTDLFVNPAAAEKMGVTLSQELIGRATKVVGQ